MRTRKKNTKKGMRGKDKREKGQRTKEDARERSESDGVSARAEPRARGRRPECSHRRAAGKVFVWVRVSEHEETCQKPDHNEFLNALPLIPTRVL